MSTKLKKKETIFINGQKDAKLLFRCRALGNFTRKWSRPPNSYLKLKTKALLCRSGLNHPPGMSKRTDQWAESPGEPRPLHVHMDWKLKQGPLHWFQITSDCDLINHINHLSSAPKFAFVSVSSLHLNLQWHKPSSFTSGSAVLPLHTLLLYSVHFPPWDFLCMANTSFMAIAKSLLRILWASWAPLPGGYCLRHPRHLPDRQLSVWPSLHFFR